MERRLAAVLVADIVGSSRLIEADEEAALTAIQQRMTNIVEPSVRQHAGRVVKFMGDGMLAEFGSAVNAVKSGLTIQQEMAKANEGLGQERQIVFRIGINVGDVVEQSDDIFGDGVNIASRVEAFAEPGGICITASVRDAIIGKVAAEAFALGEKKLKNIEREVQLFRLMPNGSVGANTTTPTSSSSEDGRPSIAVLPFTNLGGDSDQDYFVNGITEDIITELARNRGLFVVSRNSSFAFKGAEKNVREIGSALGARYVVEGSVRRAGTRIRVNAQVVETKSGNHIWAERYERELQDIFAVQDELTRSISAAVPTHLELDIVKASRTKPTENLGAYDHYLRGMDIVHRWRDDDIVEAVGEFQQAVRLDPNFARARAALGHAYLRTWWQSLNPDDLRRADVETEFAVNLDGQDGRCLSARAMCLIAAGKFDPALQIFHRALRLTPDDADLNERMAYYELCIGEAEKAIKRANWIMESHPLFFPNSLKETLGSALMMARNYEEAVRSFMAISDPGHYVHVRLAGCLIKLGRLTEAREQVRLATQKRPEWSDDDWGFEFQNEVDKRHERELVRLAIECIGDGR